MVIGEKGEPKDGEPKDGEPKDVEQNDVEPKDVENLFLRKREPKDVEDLKEVVVVIVRQLINFYLFQHYLLFFS